VECNETGVSGIHEKAQGLEDFLSPKGKASFKRMEWASDANSK
jgi:hypothetical protein